MALRIIIGLALTVVAAAVAGQRLFWLYRLGTSGQPAPERIEAVRQHPARDAEVQATEVFGQRKLLQWTVPGIAHFLTFWGFIILFLTIIEAYGDLFSKTFAIPGIGHWAFIGFIEDLFAVAVLVGIATFTVIRLRQNPKAEGRESRFSGSHTGAAWLVLLMIFGVIATLLIYRGAQINTGHFPYAHGAFASQLVGHWLAPAGKSGNLAIETTFILLQLAVVLGFGVFLTYSKHLHIVIAPLNVLFSRRPNGLRALQPMRSNGKLLDFEEADPDTDVFGLGKIEDLTWKGMLDLGTCTECGRCQSQCPAWATGKPLSPKMLILDLRDHAFAKAPYLLAADDKAREALPDSVKEEANRPLVGTAADKGVIDPDVLWSCTNCGACVHECPVDIEHIDHITGLRRHQVLIESAFPQEASGMLKNLENKGDPWGMGGSKRTEWMTELDFEVPVVDGAIGDDVEYLFWVGCAGALEDRAKKTTKAIAELLHTAGVSFAVLGPAETCTGDPARRMGNEFVFSMLAQQNIETLNEAGAKKIIASCPHCFNTIANEYPQLGGNYEVMHHTQLLARLVTEGKLKPVNPIEEKITYHDPCFLGRHNRVFTPPREIMEQVPGVQAQEMHRCKERGFCCGAGGARMWMEERIGKRINTERIEEALGTDPDTISTGCPYCLVMLGDAISAKKSSGEAKESLEVVDVAQLLIRSVERAGPAAPAGSDQDASR
ncbi:MAG TPA: (Fe-S)-binding protein [Streptosporangiaceae bacterium]|nr:(Fe-S)-binding protein [Streptosporangiaceae bacterium]